MSASVSRHGASGAAVRRPRAVPIGGLFYVPKPFTPAAGLGIARAVRLEPPYQGAHAEVVSQLADPDDPRGCDHPQFGGLACTCHQGAQGEACAHVRAVVAAGLVEPVRRAPKRQSGLWPEWADHVSFWPTAAEGGAA